ncbi:MAG: glycosyltransferase family 39 protein, partial [Acidobacteria bacterium]|nr:glycosyltransferase family 39 protein [Acidobacteriota bacterium]
MVESTGPTTDLQDPREATLRDLAWRDLIPPVLAVTPVAWGLAAAQMLLRLLTHGNYGVFRDEFYYLACADHLAWGYVDHPPLSIALLWLQRALFGDSVIALRLLPTLAAGFLVLMTAVLARELGGGRFAQGLAALTAASVPQYLGMTGFYSMNAIDLVVWVLVLWLVARVVITDDPRLWLPVGLVAGLGLLNKISVLLLGLGLVVGLLATPLRRHLRSRWLWLGGGLAGLLFLPHLIWQMVHGWPTLEFIANAIRYKIAALSTLDFLATQVMDMSPFLLPLWLAGLLYLLFDKQGRRFRVLGLIYVAVLVVLIALRGKPYYLAPTYPVLLAAGCVATGRLLAHGRRRWLRPVLVVFLLLTGALTAPMAAPILPVERFIAYQRALRMQPTSAEDNVLGPLPPHFADRFGWQELTTAVVAVWKSLPEEER